MWVSANIEWMDSTAVIEAVTIFRNLVASQSSSAPSAASSSPTATGKAIRMISAEV